MKLIRENPFLGKKIILKKSKNLLKISLFTGTLLLSSFLFKGITLQSTLKEDKKLENVDRKRTLIEPTFDFSKLTSKKILNRDKESLTVLLEDSVTREEEIKALFSYYGKVFQINWEIAYEKAKIITGNFQNPEYKETYTIGNTTVYGEKKDWSIYPRGQEIGILTFMRDLRTEAFKFDLNQEKIKQIDLPEEKSIYDLVSYFSKLFLVDPYIVYSIMSSECGADFSSNAAMVYHNYAGLMDKNTQHLYSYPTKDFGILEAILNFKIKYNEIWLQEDSISNKIEKIGEVYAPIGAKNDPSGINQYWAKNVLSFYTLYQMEETFQKEPQEFIKK